ncbi:XrtA/PEP-CTERM system TPR-repeat protein PrsT [Thauera sinica]|uniref:XrtA/PEP-CTERM system TPR-repeat protein PrsT n=1 Tax=Thauera sinica TaxID=2665146 RepID=A0ABW1ATH3_9RHOO|nr:XrtA/PEP-CTERM system TPR-repeat protein PrsT [Thauera sp. K11]ATE61299.1 PEP-CTERM system TPR-repeat protein PrsT [Thauera sp. K11]
MTKSFRPLLLPVAVALGLMSLPVAALADAAAASRYYEDGLARYQKQDVTGAIIQLKNALQQDRNMLAAHLLLGNAYLHDGDVGPAEVEFNEALRLGVNRAEVAVPLGRIYLLQGRPGKLIESIPADGLPPGIRLELLAQRGTAYAALDKRAEAERSFADARAIDPASPVPLIAEVPMLIAAGRMDLARERAAKAVQLGPTHAAAYNVRGSVAHAGGDVAAALKDYERAIELQPGFVDARVARAGILIDLGRDADARTDLEDLAKDGPVEPRASYLLALLASRRGDAAQATQYLEEAARLVDALPIEWLAGHEPLLMVGALSHHAGRQYEKARKYLDSLVARFPRNLGARKLLASIHVETADYARATGLLEQVLRAQPDDPQALHLLGRVYLAQKRYAKATELLEKAAQGGDTRAQAALGVSRLGQGDTVAAAMNLQAAFDGSPGDLGLATTLSNTLMRQGYPKKALDVAQRASAALPGNPAALNLLGVVKGGAGDRAGARAAYTDALGRDPGFTPARFNLARLDIAEGRFDDARKTYAEMLKKDRRDATAMYESALLEQRAGSPAEAMRWLEKASAERPNDTRVGLALVRAKAMAGDRPGALEAAKALAARRSDDLAVLAALAQAQLDSGDGKSAQQTLRDMTKLAEFDTDAQVRVGRLQLAAGNPAGAQYSAEKALAGRPGDAGALILAAEAAMASTDFDKARERTRTLRDRHPGNVEGLRLGGDLALLAGRYAEAEDAYREAARLQPSGARVLSVVRAQMAQGKRAQAVATLEARLQQQNDDAAVRQALAELHMRAGSWPAAAREYRTLVDKGAAHPGVLNNYALVLHELGDAQALAMAERAHALAPADPNVVDTYGWLLLRAGRREEGMRYLREARLRDPDNLEIRYHLARALHETGRTAEARAEMVDVSGMPAASVPEKVGSFLREINAGK